MKRLGEGINTRVGTNLTCQAIGVALCIYFVIVLLLMYIGQQFWGFCFDHQRTPDNLYLLLPVAALTMLWIAISVKENTDVPQPQTQLLRRLRIGQVCFLLFQFVWVYFTRYLPSCESAECYQGAYALATGVAIPNEYFFRVYSHNATNALLTSYIIRIALSIGMDPMTLFPYFGAMVLNLTTYSISRIMLYLTGKTRILWLTFAVGNLWIGLSQFMMIPYSDIYCVVFPVLAIRVLTRRLSSFWKWFWFSLLCFAGAAIRPTVLILWIAYVLCRLSTVWRRGTSFSQYLKRAVLVLAACCLAWIPIHCWKNAALTALAGESNPPETLSVTHYLMMGANYKTFGEFSGVDYLYSLSFASPKERQAANLEKAWQRVSNLSPRQLAKFTLIKLYKPLADGNFFSDCPACVSQPERNDAVSPVLRDLYMKEGETHVYYVSVQQIFWLAVLGLACACAFTFRRQPPLFFVIGLSVLGLTIYNLLGENWPRYTFVFAPLYLMLAMLGLSEIASSLRAKRVSPVAGAPKV